MCGCRSYAKRPVISFSLKETIPVCCITGIASARVSSGLHQSLPQGLAELLQNRNERVIFFKRPDYHCLISNVAQEDFYALSPSLISPAFASIGLIPYNASWNFWKIS